MSSHDPERGCGLLVLFGIGFLIGLGVIIAILLSITGGVS